MGRFYDYSEISRSKAIGEIGTTLGFRGDGLDPASPASHRDTIPTTLIAFTKYRVPFKKFDLYSARCSVSIRRDDLAELKEALLVNFSLFTSIEDLQSGLLRDVP